MGSGDLGLPATKPDVAAGKKRKKLLPQEVVHEITTRPAIPDELLPGFSEECQAAFAMHKTDTEKLMALDADIIRQYKDNGYAEVTDDEEEEKKKTNDEAAIIRQSHKDNGCSMKKRKKQLVKTRVPQEVVHEIMRMPITPFPVIPDDLLAGFSNKCRAAFAMEKADTEELVALNADIIRQYKDNGYAEVEEEITHGEGYSFKRWRIREASRRG